MPPAFPCRSPSLFSLAPNSITCQLSLSPPALPCNELGASSLLLRYILCGGAAEQWLLESRELSSKSWGNSHAEWRDLGCVVR